MSGFLLWTAEAQFLWGPSKTLQNTHLKMSLQGTRKLKYLLTVGSGFETGSRVGFVEFFRKF